jgi:FAD/FMN-containing dehydrogenase
MTVSRRSILQGFAVGTAAGLSPAMVLARSSPSAVPKALNSLDARLKGDVLTPGEAGYDAARRTFSYSPRLDRRPAAVVRCESAEDVRTALMFARDKGLEVAVKSGGHDALAASTCDDGLVIDLGRMNRIDLADNGNSFTVGTGALAGDILDALAPRDLVAVTGNYHKVGIGGLTLGGGLGPLLGKYGAACDNLIQARLVLPDGAMVVASANEHPDLFWAIKGGGGNFGIATDFTFRAHHLPEVLGGVMVLDGRHFADFLRFFPEFMASAPAELVVDAHLMSPGRPIVMIRLCYSGNPADADKVLAPLRKHRSLLVDGLRKGPFLSARQSTPEADRLIDGDAKGGPSWTEGAGFEWRGGSINRIDEAAITAIMEVIGSAPSSNWAFDLGHHMHGAVCEVGFDQSPLPRPRNNFTFHVDGWWGTAAEAEQTLQWLDRSWKAIQPHAVPTYVNYISTEDPAAVAAAYGPALARLREVKRRYDPENILHRNRNIKPA